jgi:hypothetical protein
MFVAIFKFSVLFFHLRCYEEEEKKKFWHKIEAAFEMLLFFPQSNRFRNKREGERELAIRMGKGRGRLLVWR